MTEKDVLSTGERLSLTCPFLQRRMRQAARTKSCTHVAAFCASSQDGISRRTGGQPIYRCPICTKESTELMIDAALTLFLSTYPNAATCSVRRAHDGGWQYSRPQAAQQRVTKRRRHLSSAGGSDGGGNGGGSGSGSGSSSAAVAHSAGRSYGGGDGDDGSAKRCRVAGGFSSSSSSRVHPTSAGRQQPQSQAGARLDRRAARIRQQQLEQMRAVLIRRALHEDGSMCEEALWAT